VLPAVGVMIVSSPLSSRVRQLCKTLYARSRRLR
jgi:hypothetical protein